VTDAPRSSAEFVRWLATRHSGLAPLLDEHLGDHDELLPHVLFGDVTRYASALARRGDLDDLSGLLSDLDGALDDSDDEVDNLISVSFVENAQGVAGDDEAELRRQIRRHPNLARQLSRYE
jgi:hypothetical protein